VCHKPNYDIATSKKNKNPASLPWGKYIKDESVVFFPLMPGGDSGERWKFGQRSSMLRHWPFDNPTRKDLAVKVVAKGRIDSLCYQWIMNEQLGLDGGFSE